MIKKFLIIANTKMNLNIAEMSLLVNRLDKHIDYHKNMEIVLAPSFQHLASVYHELNHRKFKLAAQDGYYVDAGAYTGQVSFAQLSGLVEYTIVGHSERRRYFNDDLATVAKKVEAAVRNNIKVILAVGETNQEKIQNETKQVLHDQITSALKHITPEQVNDYITIAYEPVWAIGGHQPASALDIDQSLSWCRSQIEDLYGQSSVSHIRFLYGGSIELANIEALLAVPNLNGLLVGHASLNYLELSEIVKKAFVAQLK